MSKWSIAAFAAGAAFLFVSCGPRADVSPALDISKVYAFYSGHCVTLKNLPAGWRSELHPIAADNQITFEKPVRQTEWLKNDGGWGPDTWDALVGTLAVNDVANTEWMVGGLQDRTSLGAGTVQRLPSRDIPDWTAYEPPSKRIIFVSRDTRTFLQCQPPNPPWRTTGTCVGSTSFVDPGLALSLGFPLFHWDSPVLMSAEIRDAIGEITAAARLVSTNCPSGVQIPARPPRRADQR